jgi:hypothetical protein
MARPAAERGPGHREDTDLAGEEGLSTWQGLCFSFFHLFAAGRLSAVFPKGTE